jgi:hypothetical protein
MRAVSINGMVLGGTYARKQAVALRLLQNGKYWPRLWSKHGDRTWLSERVQILFSHSCDYAFHSL